MRPGRSRTGRARASRARGRAPRAFLDHDRVLPFGRTEDAIRVATTDPEAPLGDLALAHARAGTIPFAASAEMLSLEPHSG